MLFTTPEQALDALEAKGIEARRQSTYFGDEYCVHIYGNNRPAAIYPGTERFLGWANAVFSQGLLDED
jgi:hypothetical protein